ncbi:MAG: hypothetical protein JWP87_3241 [Labilithrix sp.]|nr:hypothetical protein [Labilithrix sp.]
MQQSHPAIGAGPRPVSSPRSRSFGSRLTRTHALALLVLAFIAWMAVTFYIAAQHGAQRRMTFNGSVR